MRMSPIKHLVFFPRKHQWGLVALPVSQWVPFLKCGLLIGTVVRGTCVCVFWPQHLVISRQMNKNNNMPIVENKTPSRTVMGLFYFSWAETVVIGPFWDLSILSVLLVRVVWSTDDWSTDGFIRSLSMYLVLLVHRSLSMYLVSLMYFGVSTCVIFLPSNLMF